MFERSLGRSVTENNVYILRKRASLARTYIELCLKLIVLRTGLWKRRTKHKFVRDK
jgi:hypothetical protein